MKNHDGCIRGFFHLSEAWYGDTCFKNSEYLDIVTFGMYADEGGGSTGEMSMRWYQLGCRAVSTPKLEVFDDAWNAMWNFRDLLEYLSTIDSENIQPKEFCELLLKYGFKDMTPRERR